MNTLTTHNAAVHTTATTVTAAVPNGLLDNNVGATATRFGVRHVAGILMLTSLLACGSMPGERAISGAGIGAGAGAAVGAVTGMGVGTGAAIGAAAGAAAGGLTKEKDVNLGKPVWK